ncbi:MAG: hypothetical protein BWX69_03280 [Planctomycetes bacterium ADurb.Bin069]|nr:MAG: hypothetical protein BWX69_03280 [Planctomycetes bacterium ADurb.Bin069]
MSTLRVFLPLSDCEPWLTLRATASGRMARSAALFSAGMRGSSVQSHRRSAFSRKMFWMCCTEGCRAGASATASILRRMNAARTR